MSETLLYALLCYAIESCTACLLPFSRFLGVSGPTRVCKSTEDAPGENPFLCMDLTYICVLLQELGFQKSKVFKLARKINDVETSWALGALFHYVDSLNRPRY